LGTSYSPKRLKEIEISLAAIMLYEDRDEVRGAMTNVIEELEKSAQGREPARPQAPVNKSKALLVLGGLAVVAAIAATAFYLHFRDRVSTDDAQVDAHLTSLAPKISGNVVEVLVDDNQAVKAGQVLLRIDASDYQAKVDQARALLLQAQSQARAAHGTIPLVDETTQSGTSAATAQLADAEAEQQRASLAFELASGSDLAFAEANVSARQAANDRAQADLSRMQPLIAKAEISQQQYDAYVAAARVAESELRAAREKQASAAKDAQIKRAVLAAAGSKVAHARALVEQSVAGRRQVAIRTADAGSAAAAVAQARANLAAAELLLGYTTIAAPVDGVVTRKTVQVGNIVQPGQSLMSIVPLHDVWVTANFKETQLAAVRPGQDAEIKVDMYGQSVRGRVDSIAAATGSRLSLLPPENATGNFVKVVQRIPVKIRVENRPGGVVLRPGMNVEATILTR
jgi:membrane fusion protein, multidrug efflux system